MRRRIVIVNDKMQQGYRYELAAPAGRDFGTGFRPDFTPKEMLKLGIFCEQNKWGQCNFSTW